MNFNPKLIDFFNKHNMYEEKMFKYFSNNTTMLDYDFEEQKNFTGCWPLYNQRKIITGAHLNIPYVKDEKTMLVSIHELTHGIELYKKIGKPYKRDITVETLPLLYERLFVIENPSEELINYANYLDSLILSSNNEEYIFALKVRDSLLKDYNYDMNTVLKKVKKLSKKRYI